LIKLENGKLTKINVDLKLCNLCISQVIFIKANFGQHEVHLNVEADCGEQGIAGTD
jgi:hypothetical protein